MDIIRHINLNNCETNEEVIAEFKKELSLKGYSNNIDSLWLLLKNLGPKVLGYDPPCVSVYVYGIRDYQDKSHENRLFIKELVGALLSASTESKNISFKFF